MVGSVAPVPVEGYTGLLLACWGQSWVLHAYGSRLVLVLPCSRFCLINAGVLYVYFSNYLQIDEEEYGGTWELTKEGFMTSFALFMVSVTENATAGCVIS